METSNSKPDTLILIDILKSVTRIESMLEKDEKEDKKEESPKLPSNDEITAALLPSIQSPMLEDIF